MVFRVNSGRPFAMSRSVMREGHQHLSDGSGVSRHAAAYDGYIEDLHHQLDTAGESLRTGTAQMDKVSLPALGRQHLAAAHDAHSGRSAHTVYGGHQHTLRQTLIALTAGTSLDDHDSPGEATIQVLHGRVRLTSPDTSWDGRPGDHLIIPSTRHGLHAVDDCVVLLTVAKSVQR